MAKQFDIKIGDELFVNGKWFFDIMDIKNNNFYVQILHKSASLSNNVISKMIYQIPISKFKYLSEIKKGVYEVSIQLPDLRNICGGNISNFIIYKNVYKLSHTINESSNIRTKLPTIKNLVYLTKQYLISKDVTYIKEYANQHNLPYSVCLEQILLEDAMATQGNMCGMGAVGDTTTSNTPGTLGNTGTDLAGTLGFTSIPSIIKKKKKYKRKNISNVIKESIDEYSYKTKVFNFLDYPFENDAEKHIIQEIEPHRNFIISTVELPLIKAYLNDIWKKVEPFVEDVTMYSDEFSNRLLDLV